MSSRRTRGVMDAKLRTYGRYARTLPSGISFDADDQSGRGRCGKTDVVDRHDLLDDGQSQAAAAAGSRIQSYESIEHVVAMVFGNAGAIVLDLQTDAVGGGLAHPNGDPRTIGTVAQGVVDLRNRWI